MTVSRVVCDGAACCNVMVLSDVMLVMVLGDVMGVFSDMINALVDGR